HDPSDPGARRIIGRLLGIGIVGAAVIAVAVTLLQWATRPQTDDATVRANFVGIAPQVNGHIVELHVRDNQQVREGDLLFLIDSRPYEIALERARATLALTRKEVDGLKNGAATAVAGVSRAEAQLNASAAEVNNREMGPVVADAEISRLEAQFQHADDHLKRLEPLLPQQFVTADRVEEARTQRATALAALDEARARKRAAEAALMSTRAQHIATEEALHQARSERSRAEDAIGQIQGINARIAAAEAAVHAAELDLSYCRVRAPFTGLVVNMNISNGAFARAGVEVFTLVDTRTWYVVANFRETQLRHIPSGAPADLYLQSQPGKHFRGTVVGLGWAVLPENGTSVNGLPVVERSLDWIRLAARFPVRIKVENPDDSFHLGASAVATVRGTFRTVGQ
ncbi:MAG TPA: HlyD family efflux transporter periplasmic adaptor subunit, partial [Candidatus Binatia bacterium]|nr:HlyD family efflux transporter periplasmic adaptor subunit [Candidatus Binatia bacterium]